MLDLRGSAIRQEKQMPRRLLVVITAEVAEMIVVAPASDLSRLEWLTNAEDNARKEAASLATTAAAATPTENLEARVGDSAPAKTIEDALRMFAADEILAVAHPEDQAGWLEERVGATAQARFRLPITPLAANEGGLGRIEQQRMQLYVVAHRER
jgi:hypothetical protein